MRQLFDRAEGEKKVPEALEGLQMMPVADHYADCAVCQKGIRSDESWVSIMRNVERHGAESMIETTDSVILAILCRQCGERIPASSIRISFDGAK